MACGALHIRLRPYIELATWNQSSASVCTNPDKLFPSHGSESVLLRRQCPLMASHQSAQMPTQRWWLSICLEVLMSIRTIYAIPRHLLCIISHPLHLFSYSSRSHIPWFCLDHGRFSHGFPAFSAYVYISYLLSLALGLL